MGKIFLVLGLGFLLGFSGRLKEKFMTLNSRMQTVWLMLLIFCMGVSIGRNREVIGKLPEIGASALLYSVLAILGSVAVVYVFSRIFFLGEAEK